MSAKQRPAATWLPRPLISQARGLTYSAFERVCGSPFFLLVLLDAPDSELANGLKECEPGGEVAEAISTRTAHHAHDPFAPNALMGLHMSSSASAGMVRMVELLNRCCYALPLRKRSATSFMASLSIGRGRDNDVVLRHGSVSKLHATMEIMEDELFIKDNESRNHTYLNHEIVAARTVVNEGDNVRFGWVEAVICTSQALWQLAQRGAVGGPNTP